MVLPNASYSETTIRELCDPYREINSPAFFEALGSGNPGCERAFSRLVLRTHSPLTSYVRRYFQDSASVQDVLQETYLAVHRGLPGFEGRCKLSTWIFSLAYHKVCDRLADRYREKDAGNVPCEVPESMESSAPSPDSILNESELVRMVASTSAGLSRKYRDVHNLRDFEGLSGGETAVILGIPESLVRVRLHRARCMIVEKIRIRFPGVIQDEAGR